MSKSERIFIISALFGIALHTVGRDTPVWLKVSYAAVMFVSALYAIAGACSTPKDGAP